MLKNKGIEYLAVSDCRYDMMVIELYLDGKFLFLINQDGGPQGLIVEFPGADQVNNLVERNIGLKTLRQALEIGIREI